MCSMVASNYLTAVETLDLIRSGNLSVRQVAQDHITRFQQRDQTVHAWAHFDPERILREAERLDAVPKDQRGPLHGVTIGIKDMMSTKDMPTQHGSKSYQNHEPGEDAPAISVLRAAGALIIGKTHTTEFAMSHVGPPTTNPYDATRTPGGSSSGSGAAARDFQCHLALGTQTGGSMIRPASFNGIFALKPTWGSISKEGLKVTSLLLDTLGFFARSVADLELLAKVFDLGEGLAPVEKPLRDCRFLYLQTEVWGSIPEHTPELLRAWDKSKEILRAAGATVDEGQLPEEFNGISVDHNGKAGFGSTSKHQTIQQFEGKINLLAEYRNPSQRENLHKVMLAWCEDKAPGVQRGGFSRKQFLSAVDSIAALRPVFDRLAAGYDAIVTPSTKGAAPEGLENTGDPRFCTLWTILHTPVVNIPGFASDSGMPMGLSLVAPRYDDERLLSIAKAVAKVWVPIDEEKLRSIPAPDGIRGLSL